MEFKALSLECTYHRLLIFIQWNKSWDNIFPGAGACKSCAEPVTIWNSKRKHIWLHYSRQCQSGQYSLQLCVLISWTRKNPHPQAKEVLFRWSLYAFQYNCITKRCFSELFWNKFDLVKITGRGGIKAWVDSTKREKIWWQRGVSRGNLGHVRSINVRHA